MISTQPIAEDNVQNERKEIGESGKVYVGLKWSAIGIWGRQALQLIVMLALARLLEPSDYGLVAMATLLTGFLGIFKSLGIEVVVVQEKEIDEPMLSTLFWLNNVLGLGLTILTLAVAPILVRTFNEPRLLSVLNVMAFSFLLSAPSVISFALLKRELQFDRVAKLELITQLFSGIIAILAAFLGFGVWALVGGLLLRSMLESTFVWFAETWRPSFVFSIKSVKDAVSFGASVTGYYIFNYWSRKADDLIIGSYVGASALGFYSLAYSIMLRPLQTVSNVVGRVLLPLLSRLQDDDHRFCNAYLSACEAIAFLTFPAMLGLFIVADPFVDVALGRKWSETAPLIKVLAPVGAVQSLWGISAQVLIAKGKGRLFFLQGLIRGVLMVMGFILGVRWGVMGVATAYLLVSFAWTPVAFWLAAAHISSLSLNKIARALMPYFLAAVFMSVVVSVCRHFIWSFHTSHLVRLLVCVAIGIATYAAVAFKCRFPAIRMYQQLLSRRLRGSSAVA